LQEDITRNTRHRRSCYRAVRRTRLREAILSCGLTQRQFCADAGISESELSKYVRGGLVPRADRALAMAHVLGCTVEYLFDSSTFPPCYRCTYFEPGAHELRCRRLDWEGTACPPSCEHAEPMQEKGWG